MKNKYIRKSHISELKFRHIVRFFAEDETASKTAIYTGISRHSINKLFCKIRIRVGQRRQYHVSGQLTKPLMSVFLA